MSDSDPPVQIEGMSEETPVVGSSYGLCRVCGGCYSRKTESKGLCADCIRAKLLRDGLVNEIRLLTAAVEALLVKCGWGCAEQKEGK